MVDNNLEDPRLQAVEEERQAAATKTDELYGGLIQKTQDEYDRLMAGEQNYAEAQKQAQEQEFQLTEEKIGQQMAQTKQDYEKEQSAAYTDYQKQINPYGVESEKMAAGGMTGSGYSESAKVSMYNAYQSRVAVARESYQQAVREYDTALQEAWKLNSAALAQIAYDTLKTQTELSLKALNQGSQLRLAWEDRRMEQEEQFLNWEQDIRKQIDQEQSDDYAALLEQSNQQNQDLKAQIEQLLAEIAERQQNYEARLRLLKDALANVRSRPTTRD